jgi:hypothetical protein
MTPQNANVSPSLSTLATMYNFPPIPAPAPVFPECSSSEPNNTNHYQNGIIMAGRRLKEVFRPECPKCTPSPEPRKPIPGWTDGSTAWRAALYNLRAPNNDWDGAVKADQSRTVHNSGCRPVPHASFLLKSASEATPLKQASEAAELYGKYFQLFSRRSESRISLHPQRFRERSILKPGAEGKLLVPDVKLRVYVGSSSPPSGTQCGENPKALWWPTKNLTNNNIRKST